MTKNKAALALISKLGTSNYPRGSFIHNWLSTVADDKPDEEVYLEIAKFINVVANHEHSFHVMTSNEMAATGIKNLERMEEWTNLRQIARHALEAEILVLDVQKMDGLVPMIELEKLLLKLLTSADTANVYDMVLELLPSFKDIQERSRRE